MKDRNPPTSHKLLAPLTVSVGPMHRCNTVLCAPVKADSHIACRAHAFPLPCRAAKGLECLSHLIYTVRTFLIHTCHAATMPSPTMPLFSRPRYSTTVDRLLARVRLLPAIMRSSTKFLSDAYQSQMQVASVKPNTVCMDEEKSGSSTLQKRLSRTSSSDISGYHADIHEGHGTVGVGQGRGVACVN